MIQLLIFGLLTQLILLAAWYIGNKEQKKNNDLHKIAKSMQKKRRK